MIGPLVFEFGVELLILILELTQLTCVTALNHRIAGIHSKIHEKQAFSKSLLELTNLLRQGKQRNADKTHR